MLDREDKERRYDEEHKWTANEPIVESARRRSLQILLHRHRPNVAYAAFVEVAGAAVMNRVFPAPMQIGRERENAGHETHYIIGSSRAEIRTVSTIMEDDEHAHEKATGKDHQRNGQPQRYAERQIHHNPYQGIGCHGVDELPRGTGR